MLPKVHKTLDHPPGRPIVSGINSPTEKLSKLMDHRLKPIVTKLPSYVQDTTHMLQVLQDWNLHYGPFDDNTLLVTLDVLGLTPISPMTTSTLPSIIFLTMEPPPIARQLKNLFASWIMF